MDSMDVWRASLHGEHEYVGGVDMYGRSNIVESANV